MKNFSPLRRNFHYFKRIIENKHEPIRTELKSIEGQVQAEYKKYVSLYNTNNLTNFNQSAFTDPNAKNLRICYADRIEVNNLKEEIYNNQPIHLRYECQYCMIGDGSESFDHYLPKETFPEFAVMSLNLIPCCIKCNGHKSTTWKDSTNSRNIINFYYDEIPQIQFLQCSLSYRRNTPIINFYLHNPGGIDSCLFEIIEKHYERLHLLDRFTKKSGTEITNVINSISQFTGMFPRNRIAGIILAEAAEMKVDYGNNFWKAILRQSLASSNRFFVNNGF
jgi:5-methylcytosine-specific restriction endonuclease McrA